MSISRRDSVYDVFISYAHLDDQPLVPGASGWVSDLHEVLAIRLSMLKGQKARIWRDKRLRKNAIFDETIAEAVCATQLFLSVVTPLYIRSEYCQRELSTFTEKHPVKTNGHSRIFKVLKTPVPREKHPDAMKNILGYEFYNFDDETQHAHEFRVDSKIYREEYLSLLDDLAQEIQECLTLIEQTNSAPESTLASAENQMKSLPSTECGPGRDKGTVYVCTTSSDVRAAHDQVRRELHERGIAVIPDQPFTLESKIFETEVRRSLQQADLSVHIIGERYGIIPEDGERSIVEIQNEIASEMSLEKPLDRIIWIPEDAEPTDQRQAAFLESVMRNPDSQHNAELLVGTVEDLKGDILVKLDEIEARKTQENERRRSVTSVPPLTDQPPFWVYLIKGPYDAGEVETLEDCLWNAGMEVLTLCYDESLSEAELNEEHQTNLKQADVCVVYYGDSPERWVRKQLCDIRKSCGMKRDRPVLASAVYMGTSESEHKKRFRSNSATVIWPNGADTAEAVKSFLKVLEESRCAS